MNIFNHLIMIISVFFLLTGSEKVGICKETVSQDKFLSKRIRMVKEQIISRGIKDKLVINAMQKVQRHLFVPETLKDNAYIDSPLPIGENQTISQPYIVAFMTEALKLKKSDKVLEIGTGSGYQAAVLAEIVEKVYSIEIIEKLGKKAEKLLKTLGYNNITVIIGDGYNGVPEEAPFDAIIVTAAPKKIPDPLVEQLKSGGRMIIPVGDYYQELILIEKPIDENTTIKRLLPVRFVPMTGKAEKH